jgi:hypothetical protein
MGQSEVRTPEEQGYQRFVSEGMFSFPAWIREEAGEGLTWHVLNGAGSDGLPERMLSFRIVATGPASSLARPGCPSALAMSRAVLAVMAERASREKVEFGRDHVIEISRADLEVRALHLPQS